MKISVICLSLLLFSACSKPSPVVVPPPPPAPVISTNLGEKIIEYTTPYVEYEKIN